MQCAIYKSNKKADTYLYVQEAGNFSRVPQDLLRLLGRLDLVMTLELTPNRTLARADPEQVRRQLEMQGYYLQLPPSNITESPN
ncbi:MAG: YcgL domain-containing protein [Gammaproteobacteria bacterium]|jgi:uncharacterized protein YcgL (UPF0745 family)|nr:YcgL domain-containing protein [Gammaproteobacteria bacterium]